MTTDIIHQTAEELGKAIDRQELDPREILEEYYRVIDSNPVSSRIFTTLTRERAFREAEFALQRSKSGKRLSPLDGVPISWKDLYDTHDYLTEAGSLLLKGRRPKTDAKVLQIATNSGLVCIGKTHMSELAFSGLGLNPNTGTPPCINNLDAVAGGSSSGAAASVAFGMAAAGIGSDTGGSIRAPACWNDLVGFKPTHDQISLEGVVPLCSSLDTVGPLCRTVSDASLLYSTFIQKNPIDLTHTSLKGKSFLILQSQSMEFIREEPRMGFELSIGKLKDQGAIISKEFFPEIDQALAMAACLYCVEGYSTWKEVIEANPDLMFAPIRDRFLHGKEYSGDDYLCALRELKSLRKSLNKKTCGYDGFLLPTSPILPPNTEKLLNDREFYTTENFHALQNTRVSNLFNWPALTLPTGVPSTGISIICHQNEDTRLLRLAKAVENTISAQSA